MIEAVSSAGTPQVEFTNGSHSSRADVPREKGGEGSGFGPHELLEAALATCMAMTLEMHARREKLPLRRATVRVRLDRARPGEAVYECQLTLDGDMSAAERQSLLDAASNCPVGQTLARRPVMRNIAE